jgi:hypothetical protein
MVWLFTFFVADHCFDRILRFDGFVETAFGLRIIVTEGCFVLQRRR